MFGTTGSLLTRSLSTVIFHIMLLPIVSKDGLYFLFDKFNTNENIIDFSLRQKLTVTRNGAKVVISDRSSFTHGDTDFQD
jgi:hypothetical protein